MAIVMRVQAVAIATPVSSHFQLAMKALMAGKHVFVEKPMASSSEEARRMVEEAKVQLGRFDAMR